MPRPFRRFELLLPTSFNNGSPVSDEIMGQTLREIRKKFGAVSVETQAVEGHWEHQGTVYRDLNVSIFVDVPDTEANRQFFIEFKERLKERFQQIDIWMTTYPLEVI